MLQPIAKALLLLLCCGLLYGPQTMMQLGAWGWMLATYSREKPLEQAINDTFGGERPCDLCRLIEHIDSNSEEDMPAATQNRLVELRLILGLGKEIFVASPEAVTQPISWSSTPPGEYLSSVPTPPPRVSA